MAGESQRDYLLDISMWGSPKNKNPIKSKFLSNSQVHLAQSNEPPFLNMKCSYRDKGSTWETLTSGGESAVHIQESLALIAPKRRKLFANYRRLFDHFHESFLMINSEGQILEANEAAFKAYGYTRKQLCSMKIHDLRAEETRYLINKQLQEAYERGITFLTYHIKRNGERFPVEVSSHQVVIRSGKILLSIVRDITDRKRSEMELVRTENINVLGKVASGLAHEIRNPITCVHGFLQLAARHKISSEKFAENCDLMLSELDRANYIISQLILAANDGVINLEMKNLNHIILTMLPSIQANAETQGKTVELSLEDTPNILVNENEIRMLVSNLVGNALDSIPRSGKVGIKTNKTETALVLSIEDNGSGIKPEILNQLGTPFLTTKERGTGLGLVICQSIVNRHNATLIIRTCNLGTAIRVTFNL